MPTLYDLKPRFQAILRPLCGRLARAGITPNQVTLVALAVSLVMGFWLATAELWHAPLLVLPFALALRMALNAIDGMMARELAMESRLGAYLNELGDVIADAALYLPFALLPGVNAPLVAIVVVLAMTSEMAGVLASSFGVTRRYDGPLGKSDRAFAFGLLALLLTVADGGGLWSDIYLGLLAVLALWTIVRRTRAALHDGGKAQS